MMKPTKYDQYNTILNIKQNQVPIINLYTRGIGLDNPVPSVLVRVHNCYPYFYVRIPYKIVNKIENLQQYCYDFAQNIEQAIIDYSPLVAQNVQQVIHSIKPGFHHSFTGYQTQKSLFLRIEVIDFNLISIVATLIRQNRLGQGFSVYETHIQQISKFMNGNNINMKGGFSINNIELIPNVSLQSSCDFIIDCQPQNIQGFDIEQNYKIDYNTIKVIEQQLINIRKQKFSTLKDVQSQVDTTIRSEDINYEIQPQNQQQQTQQNQEENSYISEQNFDGGFDEIDNIEDDDFNDQIQFRAEEIRKDLFNELGFQNQEDLVYNINTTENQQNQQNNQDNSISLSDSTQQEIIKNDFTIQFSQQLINQLNQYFSFKPKDQISSLKINKKDDIQQNQPYLIQQAQRLLKSVNVSANLDYMKIIHIEISEIPQFIIVLYYNSLQLTHIINRQLNISSISKIKIFAVSEYTNFIDLQKYSGYDIQYANLEKIITDLLPQYIQQLDPDVILSWHNQQNGLGRICKLALNYEYDFLGKISRTPLKQSQFLTSLIVQYHSYRDIIQNIESLGMNRIDLQSTGRMILNIQQLIVRQLKLNSYSISAVCKALNIKINQFDLNTKILDKILNNDTENIKFIMQQQQFDYLEYNIDKIKLLSQIVQKQELIVLLTQAANLFSVPMYEAVQRGTQYRVESYLSKEAWKRDYILGPSPTRLEVSNMKALSCIPFVMEPVSKYYSYPVLIFDFESLYTSVISSYNLCYTTIFNEFSSIQKIGGCINELNINDLKNLDLKHILFSPQQCMFVDSEVKKGIFPIMIEKCLKLRSDTVKTENQFQIIIEKLYSYSKSNKQNNSENIDQLLSNLITIKQKLYHFQQQIKMLLVTSYGYASASFSGRMPCQELADSIVEISRQTLEYFINDIQQKFGVKIIYADTDSIFIDTESQVKGYKTKWQILQKASILGKQILKYINDQLKPPMKEKLERIYFPCILVTKKRYVGQSYNPDNIPNSGYFDINKIYSSIDSKGIDSIRRELPDITRQNIENAISVLFANNDLSQLTNYLKGQIYQQLFIKQDFSKIIFNRTYNDSTDNLSSLSTTSFNRSISNKSLCLLPEYTDRIDYVVADTNNKLLQNNVKTPQDMFDQNLELNDSYYFQKVFMSQNKRLFQLSGLDCDKILIDCLQTYQQQQQVLLNNISFSKIKINSIISSIQNQQQIVSYQNIYNHQLQSQSQITPSLQYNSISVFDTFQQVNHQFNMSCLLCGNKQQNIVEQQIVVCQQCIKQKNIKKQIQYRYVQIEKELRQIQNSIIFILQYCQQNCQQCAQFCQNYKCPFKILYEEQSKGISQYNLQLSNLQLCLQNNQNIINNQSMVFELSSSNSSECNNSHNSDSIQNL